MGLFEDLEKGRNKVTYKPNVTIADFEEIFEKVAKNTTTDSRDIVLRTGFKGAQAFNKAMSMAAKDEYIKSCMKILDNAIATGEIDLNFYLKLKRLIDTRVDQNIKLAMNILNAKCQKFCETGD